jgi:hypothetical protein
MPMSSHEPFSAKCSASLRAASPASFAGFPRKRSIPEGPLAASPSPKPSRRQTTEAKITFL